LRLQANVLTGCDMQEYEVFLPHSKQIGAAWGSDEQQNEYAKKCHAAVMEAVTYLHEKKDGFSQPSFIQDFLQFFGNKRLAIAVELGNSVPGLGELRTLYNSTLDTKIPKDEAGRYQHLYTRLANIIEDFPASTEVIRTGGEEKKLTSESSNQVNKTRTNKAGIDTVSLIYSETFLQIVYDKRAKLISLSHPRPMKVERSLQTCGELLKKALKCSPNQPEQLYKQLGELAWFLYQLAPYERGSAAISEMISRTIEKYHYPNRELKPYQIDMDMDFIAMFSDKESFMANYQKYAQQQELQYHTTATTTTTSESVQVDTSANTDKDENIPSSSLVGVLASIGSGAKHDKNTNYEEDADDKIKDTTGGINKANADKDANTSLSADVQSETSRMKSEKEYKRPKFM
jgi:iron-sulfur cluster repair protein YtfE (RIC family)